MSKEWNSFKPHRSSPRTNQESSVVTRPICFEFKTRDRSTCWSPVGQSEVGFGSFTSLWLLRSTVRMSASHPKATESLRSSEMTLSAKRRHRAPSARTDNQCSFYSRTASGTCPCAFYGRGHHETSLAPGQVQKRRMDDLKPSVAIQRVQLPPGKGEPASRKRALHGWWQHHS